MENDVDNDGFWWQGVAGMKMAKHLAMRMTAEASRGMVRVLKKCPIMIRVQEYIYTHALSVSQSELVCLGATKVK